MLLMRAVKCSKDVGHAHASAHASRHLQLLWLGIHMVCICNRMVHCGIWD